MQQDAQSRKRGARRWGVILLIAVAVTILVWRYWPGSCAPVVTVTAAGPEAGMVRAAGVPGGRFEIERVEIGGSILGASAFVPGGAGWGLALVMLPEPDVRPAGAADRGPAALGWFADGTPLAALRFRADRIGGDNAFGIDAVQLQSSIGPFAWQLVPVPPGTTTVSVKVVPWRATPAEIAAALPSPTPARMTDVQARTLVELVGGDVGEFNEMTHHRDPAALRAYADAVVARGRAVSPALTGLSGGTIALLRLDMSYIANRKAAEIRLVPLPAGDATATEVKCRALWLMTAVDPARYDAAAIATLNGSGPVIPIVQTILRSGHLPPGTGVVLARRLLAEGVGRSGQLQDDRGFRRPVGLIVSDLFARPWLEAEAEAFLATFSAGADEPVRRAVAGQFAAHLVRDWPSPGLGRPPPASVGAVVTTVARLEPNEFRRAVAAELAFRFPRVLTEIDGKLKRATPPP